MDGSKIGIPEGESHEGSDTVNKIKHSLINNNNAEVSYYLMQNTNACNNCRGNPPNYNSMYVIADTGTTQDCIKLNTPCVD